MCNFGHDTNNTPSTFIQPHHVSYFCQCVAWFQLPNPKEEGYIAGNYNNLLLFEYLALGISKWLILPV